jgi:hypothetical protein
MQYQDYVQRILIRIEIFLFSDTDYKIVIAYRV